MRIKSCQGFALTEVLIGSAVMGVMMMGMLSMINAQNKAIQNNRVLISRDIFRMNLDRYIVDPNVILKSITSSATSSNSGNQALDFCLNGTNATHTCSTPTTGCCVDTGTGTQSFLLTDPSDPSGQTFVAGDNSNPVKYDQNGAQCQAHLGTCAFEAVATFSATCPAGQSTCTKASSVAVQYVIRNSGPAGKYSVPFNFVAPSRILASVSASSSAQNHGQVVFTNPGVTNFSVPAGINQFLVEAIGGGGASDPGGYNCGGGGGAYGKGWVTLPQGMTQVPVTVGTSGTGAFIWGGPGGSSCFGNYLCAGGGQAATLSPSGGCNGGAGGTSAAPINFGGGSGGVSYPDPNGNPWNVPGAGGLSGMPSYGTYGVGYGSGPGVNGALSGMVILTW